MRISLVAVGKLRPALREVCDDYLRRFRRVVPVSEVEIREAGRSATASLQRETESRRIVDAIPADAELILLDRLGQPWSSEQLAGHLERWRLDARDRTLVIGGANGVAAALRDRATVRWSLGPLTFPHELARVVVAEQLYRAGTILLGTPYHKGGR